MNDHHQLLDNEHQDEFIHSKWIIVLVIFMITFPYLRNILELFYPPRLLYNETVHLYETFGDMTSIVLFGVFQKWTKRIMATGAGIMVVLCGLIILKLNAPESSYNYAYTFIYALGSGLIFYPFLYFLLGGSRSEGYKQSIIAGTLALSFLFDAFFSWRGKQFIHPENIGFFPLIICAFLFLVIIFIVLRKGFFAPVNDTPLQQDYPNHSSSKLGLLLLMLTSSFFFLYAAFKTPENRSVMDFYRYSELFSILNPLLPVLILLVMLASKKRLSENNIIFVGSIIYIISSFVYALLIASNGYVHAPTIFYVVAKSFIYTGSYFIVLGTVFYTLRWSILRQSPGLMIFSLLPSVCIEVFVMKLDFDRATDLLMRDSVFYSLFAFSILIFIVYLYLNRKTKTIPHEQPD